MVTTAPRVSTLGYALLGLLARGPLSGYELTQQMRQRIGPAWSASHSQIYPELARLSAADLVSVRLVEQSDRPNKKEYSVTAAGTSALASWVLEPPPTPPLRDELLLKVYSVWTSDPRAAADLVDEQRTHHAHRLAFYRDLLANHAEPAWEADGRALTSPWLGTVAIVRRGVGYESEYVSWCDWLIDVLRSGE